MAVADTELDERALVRSLKVVRELIEEDHGLEVDRAACVRPLAFETATPLGDANRTYRFGATGQPSRAALDGAPLKVGDGVAVLLPDGREAGPFGVISTLNAATVMVEFGRRVRAGLIPSQGALRARVDENQRTIRLQAIERVVRERHRLAWIGAVLTEANVAPLAVTTWDPPSELGITDGQRRALVGATSSRDLFLIQGPPGTGKTTVIAALLRHLAGERGARVLLSSKSHRPIDNALDRLGQGDLHVLRLGHAGKVTGAGQEVRFADVVAQAERDVPRRHLAARTELEDWLQSLGRAEQMLADIDALNRRIGACEVTIPDRVAEIEPERALEQVVNPLRRFANRLRRSVTLPSATRPARPPAARAADVISDLRTHHRRLATRAESTLSSMASSVCGLQLPPLSVATASETRASLTALRQVRGQAKAALHELEAWGTVIEQPGVVADVLVETADVIAATAVGVNSGRDGARIAELDFDVAIVDEAGQAQLTDLIVPFSRARTIVLVGDDQQLPPYVDDDLLRRCAEKGIDTTWLEKSVFEHLWNRLPESHRARLDVQFRMPEVIAGFLGRVFYAGKLGSAPAKQGAAPVCSLFRSAMVLVDTSGAPDRGETAVSPGFVNHYEAQLVAELAAWLPAQYRLGEGLGVIAPYAAQVTAVRHAVADALGLDRADPWLFDNIATVDSFQGQERDVVIVSLTRSNAEGTVGFLSDLRRLNVTLSRARNQLVIIGDVSTLCTSCGGQERRAFADFMRDLASHVRQHGEILEVDELRRRLELG